MPFVWPRRCYRDHRRDVLLNRVPSRDGQGYISLPYDSADVAMQYARAPEHDPPRPWGTMDLESPEVVEVVADTPESLYCSWWPSVELAQAALDPWRVLPRLDVKRLTGEPPSGTNGVTDSVNRLTPTAADLIDESDPEAEFVGTPAAALDDDDDFLPPSKNWYANFRDQKE
jgi:hypothetical protein